MQVNVGTIFEFDIPNSCTRFEVLGKQSTTTVGLVTLIVWETICIDTTFPQHWIKGTRYNFGSSELAVNQTSKGVKLKEVVNAASSVKSLSGIVKVGEVWRLDQPTMNVVHDFNTRGSVINAGLTVWSCDIVGIVNNSGATARFNFGSVYHFDEHMMLTNMTRVCDYTHYLGITTTHVNTVVTTITFTLGDTPAVKKCNCDSDHPHNERGCYFGMCGCRVGKKG